MKIYMVLIYIQVLKFSGYSLCCLGLNIDGRWSRERAEWNTRDAFAGMRHHPVFSCIPPLSPSFFHLMKSLSTLNGRKNWNRSLILPLLILNLKQGFRKSKLFFFSSFPVFSSLDIISTKWEVVSAWTWSKEVRDRNYSGKSRIAVCTWLLAGK